MDEDFFGPVKKKGGPMRVGIAGAVAMLQSMYIPGSATPRSFDPDDVTPIKEEPKGKKFTIDGVEVYALNYNNAKRKVKNIKTGHK